MRPVWGGLCICMYLSMHECWSGSEYIVYGTHKVFLPTATGWAYICTLLSWCSFRCSCNYASLFYEFIIIIFSIRIYLFEMFDIVLGYPWNASHKHLTGWNVMQWNHPRIADDIHKRYFSKHPPPWLRDYCFVWHRGKWVGMECVSMWGCWRRTPSFKLWGDTLISYDDHLPLFVYISSMA